MKPRVIVAALVVLVLTWTGTFLHDIDDLAFDLGPSSHDIHTTADHHARHFHGSSHDDAPVIGAPEMHGHDPSVLSSVRNGQEVANLIPATVCAVAWSPVYLAGKRGVLSNACRERPPPRKIPTYLLHRAMLI